MAIPGSISRRDAKTCRASSGDGLATKAPRLRSMRTSPSKDSICSAARTTVRLTSNSAPTSASDSFVPGARRRSTIASRNWSRIAWARSSGRAVDCDEARLGKVHGICSVPHF